jgi:colicin import membrane protein
MTASPTPGAPAATVVPLAAGFTAEVRARVFEAAQSLFEASEFAAYPTVDQVRRQARVDMNAASALMREWRREQAVRAAPRAVVVPEPVAAMHGAALAALWTQAQQLANESLQAAQASWDEERAQLETLRAEVASAFESQASELEQLRAALDGAHSDLATARTTLESETARHSEHRRLAAQEAQRQAERLTAVTAERDAATQEARQALKDVALAREAAAHLQGQVDAQHLQLLELTHALGGRSTPGGAGR